MAVIFATMSLERMLSNSTTNLKLFCIQDPSKQAPERKHRPLHKVEPFLAHVQVTSMEAWRLGCDISGDEQTIGFQGRHADKLRITYKQKVMVFNVMPCVRRVLLGLFISVINQLL